MNKRKTERKIEEKEANPNQPTTSIGNITASGEKSNQNKAAKKNTKSNMKNRKETNAFCSRHPSEGIHIHNSCVCARARSCILRDAEDLSNCIS